MSNDGTGITFRVDEKSLTVQIGERVWARRRAKGMSQEDLAPMVGIGVSWLSHIENGRKLPSICTLWSLAVCLEVTMDYWFDNVNGLPHLNFDRNIMPASEYEERKASMAKTAEALRKVW